MGQGHGAFLKADSRDTELPPSSSAPSSAAPPSVARVRPRSVPHLGLVSLLSAGLWSSLPARRTPPRSAPFREPPGRAVSQHPRRGCFRRLGPSCCTCPATPRPRRPPRSAPLPTPLATGASYPTAQTPRSVSPRSISPRSISRRSAACPQHLEVRHAVGCAGSQDVTSPSTPPAPAGFPDGLTSPTPRVCAIRVMKVSRSKMRSNDQSHLVPCDENYPAGVNNPFGFIIY